MRVQRELLAAAAVWSSPSAAQGARASVRSSYRLLYECDLANTRTPLVEVE